MSRRLLIAGFALAALLAALAWTIPATSKPPDLPLVDKDVLAPQPLPIPFEVNGAAPSNPFPPRAEPAAAPAEPSLLFQLRPSARRTLASCLLFGAHPLLSLAPTEEVLDLDEDEAPSLSALFGPSAPEQPATGNLIIGIGVNSDAGLTGSVEVAPAPTPCESACGGMVKACRRAFPHILTEETEACRSCGEFHSTPIFHPLFEFIFGLEHALPQDYIGSFPWNQGKESDLAPRTPDPSRQTPMEPSTDASVQSVCPWMRQQQHLSDRRVVLFAESDASRDVLENLKMLHQAQTLLLTARELADAGRACEALDCLDVAHRLCPGSRIDDAVQEAAADLFDPFYCGAPQVGGTGEEQSEPPAEKTERETPDLLMKANHSGRQEGDSACRTTAQREREIELKLSQPASLHFDREPLFQVINDLQSWQNINIYVDKPALDAEEISLDLPISLKIENVSLQSALNLILKQAHLTYVIKDEVLQITTERAARGKMQRVTYAVADLLNDELRCPGAPVETAKTSREKALIRLITNSVEPREWAELGGPGTIDFNPIDRSLVVNQTPDVQEQIADLLNVMRRNQHPDAEEREESAVTIQPTLPPVDPRTPAALEQLYDDRDDSGVIRTGGNEAQEPPLEAPQSRLDGWRQLADAVLHPVAGVEVEMTDKGFQLFTKVRCFGIIWHVGYDDNGPSMWASPDGGVPLHMDVERIEGGLE